MEDEGQAGRPKEGVGEEAEEEVVEEDVVWLLGRAHDGPRTRERETGRQISNVCSWAIVPTHNTLSTPIQSCTRKKPPAMSISQSGINSTIQNCKKNQQ